MIWGIRSARVRTVDDRGRECDLVEPPGDREARAALKTRSAQVAGVEQDVSTKAGGLYGGTIGLTIALPIAFVGSFMSFPGSWPAWLGTILLAAIVGVAYWPLFPFINAACRRRACDKLKDAYRESGLCAACAYDIRELHAEDDGCVTCPECGCSWRTFSRPG